MSSIFNLIRDAAQAGLGLGGNGSSAPTSVSTTGASGVPTSNVVGTGTSTTLPVLTIPLKANTLKKSGDTWKVILDPGVNVSSSAKTFTAAFNAQDCGLSLNLTTLAGGHIELTFTAKSTTALAVKNNITPNAAPTQMTVDLTVDNNLTILCNLTNSGDIANVQSWSAVASNV